MTLATTSSASDAVSVFLPMVARNHRSRPACTLDSPFAVQIAALHQVVPGEARLLEGQVLTEAEWLAWYEEAFPTLVQALEASGACWVRAGINWSWIQPEPPPAAYVWGPYHDEKLALLAETGVQLIATVGAVPDWARGEPFPNLKCTNIRDDRLDEFGQFLTDLVNRYKEPPWNIHHWELRNEPDGVTADRAPVGQGCAGYDGDKYAQMLQVAYTAIKAADPGATVLMGGVAYDWFTEYGGPFYRYFPDEVMANGGGAYLDAINFHYFSDFHTEWERWDPRSEDRRKDWLPAPTCGDLFDGQGTEYEAGGIDLIAKASHFRNRLSTCLGVNKPLWITELAEHGYPDQPETLSQQARYVIQGHVRGLAAGAENIAWFALATPPYDASQQGLLYEDFSPKPAYFSYQTLTYELAGYEYARTVDEYVERVEGYVFRNAALQEKTLAWSWGVPPESGSLTFAPANQLRVVDRWGAVTFVRDGGAGDADGTINGSVRLQLPAVPVDPNPSDSMRFTAEPLIISR